MTWRVARIKDWLQSNTRRDAEMARAARARATPALAERLRKLAKAVSGDAVAVMIGGMNTDARWAPAGAERQVCHDCGTQCVANCSHPTYRALRTRPKPRSVLRSRLGWSPIPMPFQEEVALITMMGDIRRSEVSSSTPCFLAGLARWSGGPELPPERLPRHGR